MWGGIVTSTVGRRFPNTWETPWAPVEVEQRRLRRTRECGRHHPSALETNMLKPTVEVVQRRLLRTRENSRYSPRFLPRPRGAQGTYVLKTAVEEAQQWL